MILETSATNNCKVSTSADLRISKLPLSFEFGVVIMAVPEATLRVVSCSEVALAGDNQHLQRFRAPPRFSLRHANRQPGLQAIL